MTRRLPQTLSLTTTAWTPTGLATACALDRDIVVKGALPGETVVARVFGRRQGRVVTICEQVESPAPERVDAPCPLFPRCGGCALQHRHYDAQVEFKSRVLLDALAAAGITPAIVEIPVTGPKLGYRRRARLGVRRLESSGEIFVGFRETFGSRVMRMDACPVLAPPFDRLIGPLKDAVGALSIADAIAQIEIVRGDTDAGIIIRHLKPLLAADLATLRDFSARHAVRVFGQSGGYETVRLIAPDGGTNRFTYRNDQFGLCFEFEPTDFVQVNAHINEKLVLAVVLGLQIQPGERVVDLFCGIGNFTLAAARRGARVTGVDNDASAVQRARENAQKNELARVASFVCRDLYDPRQRANGNAYDKVLLDPPRSGAELALDGWVGESVRRIAYVSCNPQTFARDAAALKKRGFECHSVRVFDMFPHTSHVETLGLFHR